MPDKNKDFKYTEINSVNDLVLDDTIAIYIELDKENYHQANIVGMGISDKNNSYFINKNLVKEVIPAINNKTVYAYDLKKCIVSLNKENITLSNGDFDLLNALYLLNYNIKEDIAYTMMPDGYDVKMFNDLKATNFLLDDSLKSDIALKSKYIIDTHDRYIEELKKEEVIDLYQNIELPLTKVLATMEINGIKCEKEKLEEMRAILVEKIKKLESEIYELAGEEFNIASSKQLGEIIFEKLKLGKGTPNRKGYKTDVKVLQKLSDVHPLPNKVLEYRDYTIILSSYIDGIENYIDELGFIHSIFKQNFTRTGRLSSTEPNLQNIPTRKEDGKKIRQAFIPRNDLIMCIDYSQIELRILAHVTES